MGQQRERPGRSAALSQALQDLADTDLVAGWVLEFARFGLYGIVAVAWATTVDVWTLRDYAAAASLTALIGWNALDARCHPLASPVDTRFFPLHLLFLLAFGVLSAPQMFAYFIYFVTASLALFIYGTFWGLAVSIMVAAAGLVHLSLVTGNWGTGTLIANGTVFAFIIGFTYVTVQQAVSREQTAALLDEVEASRSALEEAHTRLQEQAQDAEHLARERERNRLAGEIHDTLAYTLTTLVVQLQAARRLMDGGDHRAAAAAMNQITALARDGLKEVRRSVRDLRPELLERASLEEAVNEMARGFGQATGMDVQVTLDGLPQTLSDALERTVFRCVQEALTNAHRHGAADRVAVDIASTDGQLLLTVEDDGRGADLRTDGEGFGLKTMRERVEALHGDLRVTTRSGEGFRVNARLPLQPPEPSTSGDTLSSAGETAASEVVS